MTGESGTWDPALRGWGGQGRVSCGKWLLRCNLQAEAQVEKKKNANRRRTRTAEALGRLSQMLRAGEGMGPGGVDGAVGIGW